MRRYGRRVALGVFLGYLAVLVACGGSTTVGGALPAPAMPRPGTPLPATATDWPTYHANPQRTGDVADFPDPTHLALGWQTPLDGAVYAEPLAVGGHIFVATEHDTLYALDAHTGAILWHTHVGEPVPQSTLPCGDIDPLGITGTPVYDPATQMIFAVAEVTGPSHVLFGVDANTGQVKLQRGVDPPGMVAVAHQERGALALAHGTVYIPFGGLDGDCGPYHGWVVGVPTTGNGALSVYQVPTGREGGIWTPPGPSVDAAGDLFVSVGNGSATGGAWDHSDSILRLSPTLSVLDGFAPKNWGDENSRDADLGSLGPILLNNDWLIADGKSGQTYLLKPDVLGGIGGQQAESDFGCTAFGGAASVDTTAYIPCTSGVMAVQVQSGPKLARLWQIHASGSPVIGGHTLYSIDGEQTLVAVNVADGTVRATLAVGHTTRFTTPTLYDGLVYVGTTSGISAVVLQGS